MNKKKTNAFKEMIKNFISKLEISFENEKLSIGLKKQQVIPNEKWIDSLTLDDKTKTYVKDEYQKLNQQSEGNK